MSEMTYRPLGSSGLMVSTVGLGTNAFGARIDADQTQRVVDAALDAGVTLFDTSDTYGVGASEELLGRALGKRRDDVVVATKFGMDMGGANGPDWGARASRRYVRRAVEASLRRLGTDHIDLYQLHQPDLVTPVEETLEALTELVTEGKVRYLGCSQLRGLAGRRRALDGRHARACARSCRRRTSTRSTTGPPRRSCSRRSTHLGVEPDRLLPAGLRPAHREVPPRRAGARRAAGSAPTARRTGSRTPTGTGSRRCEAFAAERGVGILDVADRRARGPAGGRQRDRRRDPARAGAGQRRAPGSGSRRPRTSTRWPRVNTDRGAGMTHASFTRALTGLRRTSAV